MSSNHPTTHHVAKTVGNVIRTESWTTFPDGTASGVSVREYADREIWDAVYMCRVPPGGFKNNVCVELDGKVLRDINADHG